jgi:hypothetical protein
MSDHKIGHHDTFQLACPKCGEGDNLTDIEDDDGLFSTCHECEYQWHEPLDQRRRT